MDFAEALECLKRGEKVIADDGRIFLPRFQVMYENDLPDDDFPLYYPIALCKDKRFRKA
jgi:hypothetical protein